MLVDKNVLAQCTPRSCSLAQKDLIATETIGLRASKPFPNPSLLVHGSVFWLPCCLEVTGLGSISYKQQHGPLHMTRLHASREHVMSGAAIFHLGANKPTW